jgi:hypothetical protein
MSCISPQGYASAERIRFAAVTTNATLKMAQLVYEASRNGQDLIDNYRKQHELAKRAQAIAEAIQGQQGMFWAAEQQFANEFSAPEPIEDVEVMGRRYAGRLVSSVLGGFATKIHEIKCNMNRYCTSANMKALQDIYLMRSFAVTAARTLGRNIAFAEYQARTDLNWERRKQAAALGRKLGGDASGLIKSAGAGLASIGAGYEQGLNSALKAIGYESGRMFETNRPSYEQVNAQYEQPAYQSNRGSQMYGPEDTYGGYSSNGGEPMYGPESTYGANSLATSISGNEVGPPDDMISEKDFRADGNGEAYDGDDMPSVYRDSLNEDMPGAQDKVRSGKWAFPVQGGGKGFVEVDMDKFAVAYADHLNANMTVPAKGPGPSDPGWP